MRRERGEYRHYVVWVNRPLFHSDLCSNSQDSMVDPLTSSTTTTTNGSRGGTVNGKDQDKIDKLNNRNSWEFVNEYGLSGLTGSNCSSADSTTNPSTLDHSMEEEDGEKDPRSSIRQFVLNEWPVRDGWETAWYVSTLHFSSTFRFRDGEERK